MTGTTASAADEVDRMLDAAVAVPLWLDTPARPAPRPALRGDTETDLVVIGGGFTGLWTALRAKERAPDRRVLLLEADRIAEHATGRNGGFCEASLTHGEANGRQRWPEEYDVLDRLGRENLAEIAATVERYGIDCDFRATASWPWRPDPTRSPGSSRTEPGFLDADAVRERGRLADLPRRRGGRRRLRAGGPGPAGVGAGGRGRGAGRPDRGATPAPRTSLRRGGRVRVRTPCGTVTRGPGGARDERVPGRCCARLRWHTVPVYDYVLATEPLTAEQLAAVGWTGRQGIADSGNQFHYYRLTADDRILWGGYDAVYHFGRRIDAELDDRRATYRAAGRAASSRRSRSCAACGSPTAGAASSTPAPASAPSSAPAYARPGGVRRWASPASASAPPGSPPTSCSTCSTASETERTRLGWCARRPLPFPPGAVRATPASSSPAGRWPAPTRTGRRNLWLRTLDRLGLGFDS